ncbi:MAG: DUF6515 family protein [Ferruginibacter sp.]
MKTRFNCTYIKTGLFICLTSIFLPISLQAQRINHGGGGRAGQTMSRPQSGSSNRSINGGNQSTQTRNRPSQAPASNVNNQMGGNRGDIGNNRAGGSNVSTGNKNNVSTGNRTNVSGNNVNIDNSNRNVNVNNSKNINVNNNHHTTVVVRPNPRPYARPPYAYGGHSYYSYHPYHYHPYHPYYWGPVYHPWGFFVAAIATTAIIVSIENQQYHYDQGIYYVQSGSGYTVVQAPVGATITTLPPNTQTVVVTETTNNYYYGGTYYEKSDKGYTVVPPTAGCVVESLPEGGEETKIGDVTYVKVGETYYQPIEKNGKNMYEVVEVKADK